ncbi:MAG: DUF2619 domain-containing protein [Lysinibacillus sp.]|nr:DUF2619 domain-containing protein [Lysinibacillus sp.]
MRLLFYYHHFNNFIWPSILIITAGIGISGLHEKISFLKMVCLFTGIILILINMKLKYFFSYYLNHPFCLNQSNMVKPITSMTHNVIK